MSTAELGDTAGLEACFQPDIFGNPLLDFFEYNHSERQLQASLVMAYADQAGQEVVNAAVPTVLDDCKRAFQILLGTAEGREQLFPKDSTKQTLSLESDRAAKIRRIMVLFDERGTLIEPIKEIATVQQASPLTVARWVQSRFRRLAVLQRTQPHLFDVPVLPLPALRQLLAPESPTPRLSIVSPFIEREPDLLVGTNHRIGGLLQAPRAIGGKNEWLLDSDRIRSCIAPALNAVGELEELVIRRRLGFNGLRPQTIEMIARDYQTPGKRIVSVLHQAFDKLCKVYQNQDLGNSNYLTTMPLGSRLADFAVFDPAEERRLAAADKAAQRELFVAHLGMVPPIVQRYFAPGYLHEDLLQAGRKGLERAVVEFSGTSDGLFYEHAISWIRQAIETHIKN